MASSRYFAARLAHGSAGGGRGEAARRPIRRRGSSARCGSEPEDELALLNGCPRPPSARSASARRLVARQVQHVRACRARAGPRAALRSRRRRRRSGSPTRACGVRPDDRRPAVDRRAPAARARPRAAAPASRRRAARARARGAARGSPRAPRRRSSRAPPSPARGRVEDPDVDAAHVLEAELLVEADRRRRSGRAPRAGTSRTPRMRASSSTARMSRSRDALPA